MKKPAAMAACCAIAFTAHAWDSSKNAIWFDGSLKGRVTDAVSVKLAEQARWKADGRSNAYRHTEIGAEWLLAENRSVALAYRHITTRAPGCGWTAKSMPHINLKHRARIKGAELRTRLRLTYTESSPAENQTDFRPKLVLLPGSSWTAGGLKPYAAVEAMYHIEHHLAFRYRAGGGLLLKPLKTLSLNLFVMQERTRKTCTDTWNETYNLGLKAGLIF